MARQIVETFTSDISGEALQPGHAVLVTLTYEDGRRNKIELDASEAEVADWASKGREIKRRGRKPGTRIAKPDPK